MPQSLLGRTLLFMLVPLVLVQAVALQIFYGSHLGLVSRRLSGSIAGEIAFVIDLMNAMPTQAERERVVQLAQKQFIFDMTFEPGGRLTPYKRINVLGPM